MNKIEKALISRNVVLIHEVKWLFENFNIKNLKVVLLKGITSNDYNLYKFVKDIDIYSPQFFEVIETLKELGYEESFGNPYVFFHKDKEYPVDLHKDIWCFRNFEIVESYIDNTKIYRLKEPYSTNYYILNKISKGEFEGLDCSTSLNFLTRFLIKNRIKLNSHIARIILSQKPFKLLLEKIFPDDYFLYFRGESLFKRILRISFEAKRAFFLSVINSIFKK